VANPSFESNVSGWSSGSDRTTLTRTCVVAHGGACSAELGRTKSSGDALLDDSPDSVGSSVAGVSYVASAWVRAPAGRTVRLRLRELSGATIVRTTVTTATGDGSWRRLVVTSAPTSSGSRLSVELLVSLTKGSKAHVDDVSLQRS
jgi:hypothetical protein